MVPDAQPPNPTINIDPNIVYNPASANQDEEYIRLFNPNAYAVDISGYELTGGVEYTFQPGVVIIAGGDLYVSPNVNAFRARTTSPTGGEGRFVQGNYAGHLSSWGETINLLDTDSNLVDTYTYPSNPSDQQRYLRVTEMMYHPANPNLLSPYNDEDFEYIELKNIGPNIELKNIGPNTLGLDGVSFTDGIIYDFPTSAPVVTPVNLIGSADTWKYDESFTDLGTAWRAKDYNDSSWLTGPAILYDETAGSWPPAPWVKNTTLTTQNGKITFYFRTHFTLAADPNTATIDLQMTTLLDDGAVFYLNGAEAYRLGMPGGTIEYSTQANRTVNNAATEGPFVISSSSLVSGDNVLAVEVHQASKNSSDVAFGLMLDANITTPGAPSISLDPNEYVLVVKDPNAFADRYPSAPPDVNILGPYAGQLSNGGETVKLEDFTNSTILEFQYNDSWYPITDGPGFPLVIVDVNDPNRDIWDDKDGWRPGAVLHGSPGQADIPPIQNPGAVVINELLAHSPDTAPDWIELHNTTDANIDIRRRPHQVRNRPLNHHRRQRLHRLLRRHRFQRPLRSRQLRPVCPKRARRNRLSLLRLLRLTRRWLQRARGLRRLRPQRHLRPPPKEHQHIQLHRNDRPHTRHQQRLPRCRPRSHKRNNVQSPLVQPVRGIYRAL
jgi:hypothetical protein